MGTFGQLFVPDVGFRCMTGELPWRNNSRGLSCIPEGIYECSHLPRSGSGKFVDVYHVQEVYGRTGILIHAGNYCGDIKEGFKSDVDGCILLGTKHGYLGTQRAVLNSKTALQGFREAIGKDPFTLTVWDRTDRDA